MVEFNILKTYFNILIFITIKSQFSKNQEFFENKNPKCHFLSKIKIFQKIPKASRVESQQCMLIFQNCIFYEHPYKVLIKTKLNCFGVPTRSCRQYSKCTTNATILNENIMFLCTIFRGQYCRQRGFYKRKKIDIEAKNNANFEFQ